MPGRTRRRPWPAPALWAALASVLGGCAPMIVADTADPCTPARRAFQEASSSYLDISSPTSLPIGHTVANIAQRASQAVGQTDQDFDRLYAATPDLPGLDRAAADEIAARQSQVQSLADLWRTLAQCRRAQAAAQPAGRATSPARLRHEEDLRALRRTEEATLFWNRRYDRLQQRIVAIAPSGARPALAAPAAAAAFATASGTYAESVATARREAADHFAPP